MKKFALTGAAFALISMGSAHAQGLRSGVQNGYDQGAAAAGPLGGFVGGAVGAGTGIASDAFGAGTGIVGGVLGGGGNVFGTGDMFGTTPSLGSYVMAQGLQSYRYPGNIRPGARLPRYVTLYVVPQQFGMTNYRYTVANNQVVLVEPYSRRVVQILN